MRKTVSPPPIVYLDVDDDDENESSQFQRQVESLNKNSFRHEKKRKNVEQAIDSSRCCVHEHKRPCSQTSSISRFIKSTIDEQQTDEDFDDRSTSDQIPWLNIPTQIPKFEKPAPKPNIISSLRIPSDDQPSAFRRVPPKHNGQLRSSTEISPENLQTHLPLPFPEQLQNSIPTKIVKKRASPTVQTKKVLQTPAASNQTVTVSDPPTQTNNDTGVFAAFHDSKCFRCNICRFKSTSSSLLLQHMFTHVFICEKCDFFSFSHYQLCLHLFDKHQVFSINGGFAQNLEPKSFDLLYLNRYKDGSFAICSTRPLKKVDRAPVQQAKNNSGKQTKKTQKISGKRSKKQIQHSTIRFHREENVCYVLKSVNNKFSFTFEFNRCREEILESLSDSDHAQQIKTISPTNNIFQVFRNFINDNENERKITQQYFEEYFCALKLSTKNPSRINDQPSWNPRDYRTILTTHSNNDHEETIISSLNQSVTSEDSPTMETALIPIDNRHLFLTKYLISTRPTSKTNNIEISSIQKRRANEKYLSNQRNNSTEQPISVIVID